MPTTRTVAAQLAAILGRLALVGVLVVATGVLLGIMFLPAALATNDVMAAVRSDILDFPPLGEADTPIQNSYVYAADGTELAELTFEENRVPVTLDQIPQVAIDAVLATEDAHFFDHEGVNHRAMIRAFLTNLRARGIESGASTITQQYVKLAFLTPEQTYARKIEEAVYAIDLEERLTKHEILERYLNRSYFGNGVYGLGTAAERYFSKDVGDLTLGESAMLAGLLRAPEANNPIRSIENAGARRDIVLRQMATHGFVSPAQAQAAIDEPLVVTISEPPAPSNPFWVDWVAQLLVRDDVSEAFGTQLDATATMGATHEERRRFVFQAGLRIHTTLDLEFQDIAEGSLREHLLSEDAEADEVARAPMGSIVSVEPGTGAIRTMAIGPHSFGSCAEDRSWVGELDSGELLCDRTKVNPAVPGMGSGFGRQPGSSFKPILDAAALEDGFSPGLVLDARGPKEIDGCPAGPDGPWTVRNSGGDGIIDMYEAVARSSNVYHALLIAEVGPEKAADMFRRLSGYQLAERDVVCPLALGAGGVHPLAMASAYATLANGGEYCAPHAITRIEDAEGRTIWEHNPTCTRVVDTEVADRIVDMLAGPVSPGGTAPVANLGDWPTRGKTGSTNNNADAWFVGFVRQLSTAAWIGYANSDRIFATQAQAAAFCGAEQRPVCARTQVDSQLLRNVTIAGQSYGQVFGGTIPAPMWRHYMEQVVQSFEPEGFPDPGPIPTAQVPDVLRASSVEEAEEIARSAGFRLVVEEISDYRPPGTFVEQVPEAGARVALGSWITLAVSDGTGDAPTLPDVTGMTLDEAAAVLFELGYNVFQRSTPVANEALDGLVIEVDPPPGTSLDPTDPDARVVLVIGVYTAEAEPPPDGDPDGDGDDGPPGQGPDGSGPPGQSDG